MGDFGFFVNDFRGEDEFFEDFFVDGGKSLGLGLFLFLGRGGGLRLFGEDLLLGKEDDEFVGEFFFEFLGKFIYS